MICFANFCLVFCCSWKLPTRCTSCFGDVVCLWENKVLCMICAERCIHSLAEDIFFSHVNEFDVVCKKLRLKMSGEKFYGGV